MMASYKEVVIEATKLPPVINAINDHMDKNSMLSIRMALNLEKIAEEAQKAKEKTKDFADSMADNIEDSIMRMTQGLMSFKDVVKSVFKFVANEMVRNNIAKPLAGALSSIFAGSQAGTIVPNGSFGGQTINVTYSPQVNALDPRTAQAVIAENATTIVGVVRQAFERNGQVVAL